MATASYYSVHFDPRDWPRVQPLLAAMNHGYEDEDGGLHLPLWTLEDGSSFADFPGPDAATPSLTGSGRSSVSNLVGVAVSQELVHPALAASEFQRVVGEAEALQAWASFAEDRQPTWAALSAWLDTTLVVLDLHEALSLHRVTHGQVAERHMELTADGDAQRKVVIRTVEGLLASGQMAVTPLADLASRPL